MTRRRQGIQKEVGSPEVGRRSRRRLEVQKDAGSRRRQGFQKEARVQNEAGGP